MDEDVLTRMLQGELGVEALDAAREVVRLRETNAALERSRTVQDLEILRTNERLETIIAERSAADHRYVSLVESLGAMIANAQSNA